MLLEYPTNVDRETWQEYLELRDQLASFHEIHPARLTDAQYWVLLTAYEPAAETLVTGSDGPGYHIVFVKRKTDHFNSEKPTI